jgi:hypothetical protein
MLARAVLCQLVGWQQCWGRSTGPNSRRRATCFSRGCAEGWRWEDLLLLMYLMVAASGAAAGWCARLTAQQKRAAASHSASLLIDEGRSKSTTTATWQPWWIFAMLLRWPVGCLVGRLGRQTFFFQPIAACQL